MDRSQVMDRADFDDGFVSPASRWLFQPDDDDAQELFFATEDEACAAQQGWRIARGFHPMTGSSCLSMAEIDRALHGMEQLIHYMHDTDLGDVVRALVQIQRELLRRLIEKEDDAAGITTTLG